MRRFIVTLGTFGLIFIVFAEIFLRISGLASDVMDRVINKDQVLVFQPGADGYRTRGMRAEVNAHYHINEQGWNSTLDYKKIDSLTIAIVGDSYIAGFWNDVDSSAAAILQHIINKDYPKVEVHSYGHPGANFIDYKNLVAILKQKGYQYIYIYINAKDFSAKIPSFTRKMKYEGRTGIRYWYRKSALLKYLNVNLGIKQMLKLKGNNKEKNQKAQKKGYEKASEPLKSFSQPRVTFFYEDLFFDTLKTNNDLIKIQHTQKPKDHGFNGHWNVNGNRNAAKSIYHHWKNNFAPSSSSN